MYIVGVGLVKVYKALLRLMSGGTRHPPSDVYVRKFLCHFFTLIKLCYTKALEWSRLVPGPKAKSVLEITNPTSFTISYHHLPQTLFSILGRTIGTISQARNLSLIFVAFLFPHVPQSGHPKFVDSISSINLTSIHLSPSILFLF